jgi:hypothetical protein
MVRWGALASSGEMSRAATPGEHTDGAAPYGAQRNEPTAPPSGAPWRVSTETARNGRIPSLAT